LCSGSETVAILFGCCRVQKCGSTATLAKLSYLLRSERIR